VRKGYKE